MAKTPSKPAVGPWTAHVTGKDGVFGRLNKDGLGDTLKKNFKLEGQKGLVFGRVVGTASGLALAAHSLQALDANGEERSGLVRVGEFLLGAGLTATSVLGGKAR